MSEALKRISYREYRIRLEWYKQQDEDALNNPTPTEYYLMNIIRYLDAEYGAKYGKRPPTLASDFKFKFELKPVKPTKVDKLEPTADSARTALSKSKWLAFVKGAK